MEERRFRYFLAVVERKTLIAAAAHLGITQPALSRQLKKLESEVGFSLFERHGIHLLLTPNGRKLVAIARQYVDAAGRAADAIAQLEEGRASHLRIAATPTTVTTIVAPFIGQLRDSGLLLSTISTTHATCYDALHGRADIAISPMPAPPELEARPLGRIPIRVWCSPEYAAQQRLDSAGRETDSAVPVEFLARKVIAVPSRSAVSRELFDVALTTAGVTPARIVECDDIETLRALALSGRALAVSADLGNDRLKAFNILVPGARDEGLRVLSELSLQVAWVRGHYAEGDIKRIAAECREFIAHQ